MQSDKENCPDFEAFCHVHDVNLVKLKFHKRIVASICSERKKNKL